MTTHASVLARAQHALAEFFRLEAAGGILLIAAAVLAMLAANSPLAHAYEVFRDTPLGGADWGKSLHWWINDGLMAVFFLLVSLEIKREVISGQLSSRDQLVLPVVCAVAGVAAPALLYTAMNHGDAGAMRGWAIPTATDIAFALGVLALLGSRVPLGMSAARRSRISAAALLVNVMARTCQGLTPRSPSICAMRKVRTRVLPEPAPARTSSGPSVVRTASR